MNRLPTLAWTCVCLAALSAVAAAAEDKALDSSAARKIFTAPPRQYATAPLWVWNDMLTDEQIRGTLRDLAGQKVRQVFVHPRPGLMTPYLSDEWFRLWKVALDEAEKLDMNVWIYDENSYPSGFAGGHVPELMPESRGRGLVLRDEKQAPKLGPDTVAVYRVAGDAVENVTEKLRSGAALPEGRYVVASVARATNSPWHGDRCYVDLMYPGVTEKFLEVTLDAYKKHIGDQFGKRVLGSFTDEPNVRPAGGLPWTDHLPAEFQKRWGYNLLDHLPSLTRPVGQLEAGPPRLLPGGPGPVHRALGQAVLQLVREERHRLHRPLLGPRMAELRRRDRQHGDERLAAHPGHRLPDEPVPRGHARPVRQRAVRPGSPEPVQPTRPQAVPLRNLRSRRLGPAVRGHEADRRLAGRAGREPVRRAPLLRHAPRRPQGRPPAVVLLPRAVVGFVSRDGRVHHAAVRGHVAGRAAEPRAGDPADDHRLDVPTRRGRHTGQLNEIGKTFFDLLLGFERRRWNTTSAART